MAAPASVVAPRLAHVTHGPATPPGPRDALGHCLVTEGEPASGGQDPPVLKLLAGHRRDADATEALARGVRG